MSRFKKKRTKVTLTTYLIELLAEPTVYERIDEYFSMIDKNDNPQVCFEKWVSILFQLLTKESGYFKEICLLTFLPSMHQASTHIYLCLAFNKGYAI